MSFRSDDTFADRVLQAAKDELERERYREAVEKAKQRLRATKWWHRFIPIITITWRKS
jgi:hypothetical protein